eukprot:CAMPEP_0116912192 /NCGR_PEP_ID=MMETSP0467-20121206/15937_1 /TAXON_ID=283647 /ORGANISM="Mesodinium pulex, Strain SPMC105" /LENGTH=58 /DNA_ID=CAMNT_0004588119 /DNA_START=597 /DNA_END=773 /DNA_ORIENTATION=-
MAKLDQNNGNNYKHSDMNILDWKHNGDLDEDKKMLQKANKGDGWNRLYKFNPVLNEGI